MTYYINYNTISPYEADATTLAGAMAEADSGAAYTQEPYSILDESGRELANRHWYGVAPTDEDAQSDIIEIGGFGFFSAWGLTRAGKALAGREESAQA